MNDEDLMNDILNTGKVQQEQATKVVNEKPTGIPIIIRKLFTLTTIKIYPGGQIYHESTTGWLDRQEQIHINKKKQAPTKIEIKKDKTVEEY